MKTISLTLPVFPSLVSKIMQQNLFLSSLMIEIIIMNGSPGIWAHVFHWCQVDGLPALLQGYYGNSSGGSFWRLVFTLPPLSVAMPENCRLQASSVAWCISLALLASGKHVPVSSVFLCCELDTVLSQPPRPTTPKGTHSLTRLVYNYHRLVSCFETDHWLEWWGQ